MSEREDEVRRILEDSQRRYIATLCVKPHSSNEILKSIKGIWSGYVADTLGSDLNVLEDSQAIVYMEDDTWKTTDIARKVLRKYFGHKE